MVLPTHYQRQWATTPLGRRRLASLIGALALGCAPHHSTISQVPAPDRQSMVCPTPASTAIRHASRAQLLGLGGRFDLTLTTADSAHRRTVAHGTLVLAPADSAHRRFVFLGHETRSEFVLVGYTTADLTPLSSLAVSPASRDANAPGVQVDAGGTMVIGNPTSSEGQGFDAGVYLYIKGVRPAAFSGAWASGSTIVPSPHGFFCARRIGSARR